MSHHTDPRRRHRAPEADAVAAAVRLDLAAQSMREAQLAGHTPRPDDEPPTGLIDLGAIRAALGLPAADVDPAAAAWLAGGPDTAAARLVQQVDVLDAPDIVTALAAVPEPREPEPQSFEDWWRETVPGAVVLQEPAAVEPEPAPAPVALTFPALTFPVEHPCLVVPNGYHSDAPCSPRHHPGDRPLPPPPAPVFSSEHPRLTWRSRHDPRSLSFGVREELGAAVPITDRLWPVGPVGDQGEEGACVGWGITDAVNARAAGDADLTAADALALYRRAQQLDDVPGVAYSGTSVLAGMQAAVEQGLFASYRWCFGTRDVAQAVLQAGPVVVGVPWLSGMYDTGPGGLVELTGNDTGAGHCLAVVGILLRGPQGQLGPYFVWQNSWGPTYGDRGLGYIHHRDLAQLLHGAGEAALPAVAR